MVRPNGLLIIGQDQDNVGGGFDRLVFIMRNCSLRYWLLLFQATIILWLCQSDERLERFTRGTVQISQSPEYIIWQHLQLPDSFPLCDILTVTPGFSYREPGGVSVRRLGERHGLEGGALLPGRGVQRGDPIILLKFHLV